VELEYYNSAPETLKVKKRLRLQKQVAIACLAAYVFLIVNFLMGAFSEPVDAKFIQTEVKYTGRSSMNTVTDITIYTDKGHFRSTQKSSEDFEGVVMLKLWQTPFYNTTVRYQIDKPNEDIFWSVVNIYIVFSFFPILGLMGAIVCLLAKGNFAIQYGFQFSIFSAIMLVFCCLMLALV